jgi:hypothetical protein
MTIKKQGKKMEENEHSGARGAGLTELPTWGKQSSFLYAYDGGLTLHYGKASRMRVSADIIRKLRSDNKGKAMAPSGAGSLDEWVKANGIQTRIASYLAPALIDLGFAERAGDKIQFPR